MKLKIEKKLLVEKLGVVSKAVSNKTTMPILEGVYLEAKKGIVTLIGSDMDLGIKTIISDVEIEKEGTIVVDSKIFNEIVRKLPDSVVELELSEDNLLSIKCMRSSFNIVVMSAEDYPNLPEVKEDSSVNIPQKCLRDMVKGVSFAVALDGTRPILQGILFEAIASENRINTVALDGYRLAVNTEVIEDVSNDITVVVPAKALIEVSRILGDTMDGVTLSVSPNHVLFSVNDTIVITRLLDGKYVNYSSLLPVEHKVEVVINKRELESGLDRASLMAKEGSSNLVKLNLGEDTITISSNSQLGKLCEVVSAETKGEGFDIAFNSRYLLDILRVIGNDRVIMEFTSPVSPCVIKGYESDREKYLVLPVRLLR